jgi:hypothetical protein
MEEITRTAEAGNAPPARLMEPTGCEPRGGSCRALREHVALGAACSVSFISNAARPVTAAPEPVLVRRCLQCYQRSNPAGATRFFTRPCARRAECRRVRRVRRSRTRRRNRFGNPV